MPLYDYLLNHPYGTVGDLPITPGTNFFYRPDITDVEELSDFSTLGLALSSRVDCVFDNVLKAFLLQSGPADGSDPGQVAPEDYDPIFNNVHWSLMGG